MEKLIEKLIELLNEYDKPVDEDERVYSEYSGNFLRGEGEDMERMSPEKLCGKKFGFIKWLVDNDKIDRDRCECRQLYNALKRSEDAHGDKNFSKFERIIMLLAISDTPIDDLISYLK